MKKLYVPMTSGRLSALDVEVKGHQKTFLVSLMPNDVINIFSVTQLDRKGISFGPSTICISL